MKRKKKMNKIWLFTLILILSMIISGCGQTAQEKEKIQYTKTYMDVFDTVTTIIGREESEEVFQKNAEQIHAALLTYHQLFDIYNEYDGVANLKTVNDLAGKEAVVVDEKILDLLLLCKEEAELTNGAVNVALGSMLDLWHEARTEGIEDPENAKLPDRDALEEAMLHTDISKVIIDEEAKTVRFADEDLKLNVGAIAKGYATEKAIEGINGNYLLSVGGNVRVTGPKTDEGTPWIVGIQDPDKLDSYCYKLAVTGGSVVTSGDYQRFYEVDGKRYHHIIDPETLMPSTYWRSVTIVCNDSGLADTLSTALFLMEREAGLALLEQCDAMAMWVDAEGNVFYSPGFENLIRT